MVDNSSYDWSIFTKRVTIASDLPTIYKAWTTRTGLESWFLSKAEYSDANGMVRAGETEIEVGDTYSWEWVAANDMVQGEVLNKEDSKSLTFSFLGCHVVVLFYK